MKKKKLPKKSSLIHSRPKMKVCRINQLLALWNKFKTCIDLMKGLFGKWIPKYITKFLWFTKSHQHCTLLWISLKIRQKKRYTYTTTYQGLWFCIFSNKKYITKAFEFSGKKDNKTSKCIVYIHHRMISRMRNRWSFAFPVVVPSMYLHEKKLPSHHR